MKKTLSMQLAEIANFAGLEMPARTIGDINWPKLEDAHEFENKRQNLKMTAMLAAMLTIFAATFIAATIGRADPKHEAKRDYRAGIFCGASEADYDAGWGDDTKF